MALHEVQVTETIIALEFEVHLLRSTLDFILENLPIPNVEQLDENRLKRMALKHVKEKFPDEEIRYGDWVD